MATLTEEDDPQLERLIDALYLVEGKAEIIDGRIVPFPMTGHEPGSAALEISISLRAYVKKNRRGFVVPDNVACLVNLPTRKSFAPDAGYFVGPNPGMKFFKGAPVFAAEVRSEGDYGRTMELYMAGKRRDYFAAGTLVIWDVDLQSNDVVRVFKNGDAETPVAIYRRNDHAEAEPAVPGWTMPVDDLFSEG